MIRATIVMRVTQLVLLVCGFKPKLYEAKPFRAETVFGAFRASGTLCGNIDFVGPFEGCYSLSPDEAFALIVMLQRARQDVLDNSDPIGDPRIVERAK